jgi:hypothetical protein
MSDPWPVVNKTWLIRVKTLDWPLIRLLATRDKHAAAKARTPSLNSLHYAYPYAKFACDLPNSFVAFE